MKKQHPDRAAVAKSLRDLEILWKPKPKKDNAQRELGAVENMLTRQLIQEVPK